MFSAFTTLNNSIDNYTKYIDGELMRYFVTLATAFAALITTNSGHAETTPYDGTGSHLYVVTEAETKPNKNYLDIKAHRARTIRSLRYAADNGNRVAMFDLASVLSQGIYGPQDLKAAYNLYEAAADKDEPRALSVMCQAYLLGINRPVNIAKAMNEYCIKIKVSQPALIFSVAYDYEHGLSGPKDETEAFKNYLLAAQTGSGEAMNQLGLKAINQTDKAEVAREWFRRGSAEGSADAMFNLAQMTAEGRGGFKDEKEAAWLYVNAARRGHKGASEWLSAQLVSPEPLKRTILYKDSKWLITQADGTKNTKTPKSFDVKDLAQFFSKYREEGGTDISATMHCYITESHIIDLCLNQAELPVGYNAGAILRGVFNDKLTISPIDAKGQSTAQSVFVYNFTWSFN
ncbi:hypothetical protein GCM10011273_00170 [Asticcacaulis endophyticus]|uniref:TPR repeat n=2 Tax=Asticcacaulis endophyticus TaxID=1395890 RepID=A0A918PQP4_9CAUL|nr:hypothetical protein GCM10011273_00170 [Asticcacaulis endophyticus]